MRKRYLVIAPIAATVALSGGMAAYAAATPSGSAKAAHLGGAVVDGTKTADRVDAMTRLERPKGSRDGKGGDAPAATR
jgi:hypothetical protein